jgi:hypothetical protein
VQVLFLVKFFSIPIGYHLIWRLSQEGFLVSLTLHCSPCTRKRLDRCLLLAYTSAVQWLVINITMIRAKCAPDDQSDILITSPS